jgi:hypothetical protein
MDDIPASPAEQDQLGNLKAIRDILGRIYGLLILLAVLAVIALLR